MFISSADARELVLTCTFWAGTADVIHRDGRRELVTEIVVKGAAESPYGCKTAWPKRRRRTRARQGRAT